MQSQEEFGRNIGEYSMYCITLLLYKHEAFLLHEGFCVGLQLTEEEDDSLALILISSKVYSWHKFTVYT